MEIPSVNEHHGRVLLPHDSQWSGWGFRHPEKMLTRRPAERLTLIKFSDEWEFRISRKTPAGWETKKIAASEIIDCLPTYCTPIGSITFVHVSEPAPLTGEPDVYAD